MPEGLLSVNSWVNMRLRVVRKGRWQVLAVCRDRGDCPLLEFLAELAPNLDKDRRRLLALFDRIEQQGPPHNVEVSHQVGDGLWEFIRGRLRVLWFYDADQVVVATHGFVKKSQKTPRSEIDRADECRAAYRQAKESGNLTFEEDD